MLAQRKGDRLHRFLPYLQRMFDRRPIILLEHNQASCRFTHGYVENVAAAIALTVTDERATGRIYNIGEPTTPTLLERIQQMRNLTNWHGEIVMLAKEQLPPSLQMDVQWQYHLATDTSLIRDELGYVEPIVNQEALQQTITWEQANLTSPTSTQQLNDYLAEDEVLRRLNWLLRMRIANWY